MIRDLSLTLQAILNLDDGALAAAFPELADAIIVFDRPDENFKPTQTTIDLFLYDVRENMELRSNEPVITRLNGDARIARPPMRVACSYLATAWPVGGTDLALQEQRLLSQTLQVLSRYPKIPASFLKGKLIGQQPPLPMMTSQADGLKEPAEFWTAIGNKLRPSISITVTIGMEIAEPVTAPVVITETIRFGERTSKDEEKISPATLQELFRIGGRVTGADDKPVAQATVTLTGTGLVARTDADGLYVLGVMPAGSYTLRAESGGTTKDKSVTIPAAGGDYDMKF
ncbi:MAG: Pvc16 family protein [Acidobacteriota bacterium]